MIPFAIFGCKMKNAEGKDLEIRALDMAPAFFTFRLRKNEYEKLDGSKAELTFYRHDIRRYETITVYTPGLRLVETNEFYDVIRFETSDGSFKEYATRLMLEYSKYIDLKLNADEAELSRIFTEYDAHEEKISKDFRTQREVFYSQIHEHIFYTEGIGEYGISLCRKNLWEGYLNESAVDFIKRYFEECAPGKLSLSGIKITHMYIGSDFCRLLYPDNDIVEKLVNKMETEGIKPVFVFPLMSQSDICIYEERIGYIDKLFDNTDKKPEIVVNDLGMLELINSKYRNRFNIILGILAVRRRKDTRLKWKKDASENGLSRTSVNGDLYLNLLKNENVSGLSYEYAEYMPEIQKEMKASLYLPYYQMNTSSFCTTYAKRTNGSRGRQVKTVNCSVFCEEDVFLYPDDLKMVGRYNSLFGFSDEILKNNDIIKSFDKEGIDRIVFNFM